MRNKPHEEKAISQLAEYLLDAEIEIGHESYIHSEYEDSEAVHILQSVMRDPATIDAHRIETAAHRANRLWAALTPTLSLQTPLSETLDAISHVISEDGQSDALTLISLYMLSRKSVLHEAAIRHKMPNLSRARKGATGKHGTAEEKQAQQKALWDIWARGEYLTRIACAADMWENLGIKSQTTAVKALRDSPDPEHWPAKKEEAEKKAAEKAARKKKKRRA